MSFSVRPCSSFRFLLTFFASLALAAAGLAATQDATAPQAPRIPTRDFSATSLGVKPGSGRPVTEALQKAIDHVGDAGGGRLVLAAGEYLLGPVILPSRFDLHLEKGAVVRLIPRDGYPVENNRHANLFSASGQTDLRISGPGRIDGQGEPWWRAYRAKEFSARRPQLIAFERCDRVELSGFTSINPPNTHVALRLCKEVTIRGVTLDAPDDSPNTDGFNLSGKNYLIERCRISTGDDNIVVLTHGAKDWPAPQCENFVIRDCFLGFGHGLSIGSYTGGGIRGIHAERITFNGTSSGIRMKAARDRGGLVEDLTYRDISMRGVKYPVFISSYYPKEPKSPELDPAVPVSALAPRWRDIRIDNIDVTQSKNSIILWGLPELPLENITIRHATFETETGAKIFNTRDITLEAVALRPASGAPITLYHAEGQGLSSGVQLD